MAVLELGKEGLTLAAVSVTAQIGATCHYWFTPEPVWDFTGQGVNVLDSQIGWTAETTDQVAQTVTFNLDDSTLWDVNLSFRGAPPVEFKGLNVSGGGDLFELLNAQGWQPL